ncbi:hypothetical protein YC2023_076879 [Brassica napus]
MKSSICLLPKVVQILDITLNAFECANSLDLSQTLEDFSEDFWKTLGRLLRKSSNAFYARRCPTKYSRSLPKSESDFGKFLRRLLEDYQKTLGILLGKSSNVFYGRRLPTESSEVFCPKWYKRMMSSGENADRAELQEEKTRSRF